MRSPPVSFAGAVLILGTVPVPQLPATLLTIPQRDGIRSGSSPSSASLTADGRYVAFTSYERLVAEDSDDRADIYVLDRTAGTVSLESATVEERAIESDCAHPRISGNGRYLLFETTLARDDGNRIGPDVMLRDRTIAVTRRLSRSVSGGPTDGWSGAAVIAAEGNAVAFTSTATNLVREHDRNGSQADVYLAHLGTETVRRVSLDSQGVQPSSGSSVAPTLSADGRYLALASTAELARPAVLRRSRPPGVQRLSSQVYIRDLQNDVTTRIAPSGSDPNGASMSPVISADGRWVAFVSDATNLVSGDRNRSSDVFLYERTTGAITLVSRGVSGRPASGASVNPALSADGRFVAFQSDASDLTCGARCPTGVEDINLLPDVFVLDRQAGTIMRISTSAAGGWMEESAAPALDALGGTVAFASKHPIDDEDVANDFDLFLRVPAPVR
jgi:Tol biopolymer transport system component